MKSGEIADIARCARCDLLQLYPLPTDDALAQYYRAYAYDRPAAWDAPASVLHSLTTLVTSLEPFRNTNNFLDVGCGAGHLLRVAQQQNWQVTGTELSDVAVERLRGLGLSIHQGAEPDHMSEESFDIITMIEVIEHLRDPRALLRRLSKFLRHGGALYLTTPNVASLSCRVLKTKWRIIEVPEHLFYFSPRSIRQLLIALGFRTVIIKAEGLNPVDLLRTLTRRNVPSATDAGTSTAVLRDAAFKHAGIGLVKKIVNFGLRWTSLGDTLKVLAIK